MSRVEFREERCKGCLLCTHVCPTEILVQSDRFNKQGYKVVCVKNGDMSGCKGCAFCAEICPDEAIIVYRSKKDSQDGKVMEDADV
ncbi:4Fe-4S dicluster domain-containing protein [Desulfonatronovibrio hydrogenovorans]|uniref:4Fe-4S dicluster domain-containing protein n=1 Tax=Desulfonatronovibrio hydrogenovorans TaxID=53245 RepID=UPI000557AA2B|nr:4Fe-4S binding protein [Desulfonatronovibrio hydrogenovorans]